MKTHGKDPFRGRDTKEQFVDIYTTQLAPRAYSVCPKLVVVFSKTREAVVAIWFCSNTTHPGPTMLYGEAWGLVLRHTKGPARPRGYQPIQFGQVEVEANGREQFWWPALVFGITRTPCEAASREAP